LRAAFKVIYRSTLTATEALDRIEEDLLPQTPVGTGREQVEELVRFCRASGRGIELRTGPPADAVTTKEDS
jgi:acyl-[acyl carrier protein]--UDP-N-acetylglucosamine O-acyltransferase